MQAGSIRRVAGAALAGGAVLAGYATLVRPRILRWGATDQEAAEQLPGDEVVAQPRYQTTHAVTIHAPPSQVWPWLVQLGQNRGGLYSYQWLENLVGCKIRNTDRIIPELQHLQIGDLVQLGPDPYPAYTVWSIQLNQALVLRTAEPRSGYAVEPSDLASGAWLGTWAFVLDQRDEQTTRLLVRLRNQWQPNLGNFLVGLVGPSRRTL